MTDEINTHRTSGVTWLPGALLKRPVNHTTLAEETVTDYLNGYEDIVPDEHGGEESVHLAGLLAGNTATPTVEALSAGLWLLDEPVFKAARQIFEEEMIVRQVVALERIATALEVRPCAATSPAS